MGVPYLHQDSSATTADWSEMYRRKQTGSYGQGRSQQHKRYSDSSWSSSFSALEVPSLASWCTNSSSRYDDDSADLSDPPEAGVIPYNYRTASSYLTVSYFKAQHLLHETGAYSTQSQPLTAGAHVTGHASAYAAGVCCESAAGCVFSCTSRRARMDRL